MTLPAAYAEYALATDDAYLNSAGAVKDAISYRNYGLRRMLEGKDPEKVLQNGKTIKNFLQLEDAATAHFYGAGGTESPTDPQVVTAMDTPWAFIRDDITYDDEAINLHEGDTAQMFFNLKRQYEQKCWLSKINFIETQGMWGTPTYATMEADTPTGGIRHMQSIPTLVTEEANAAAVIGGYTSGLTLQGIDPEAKTGWQNQRKTYDGSSATDILKSLSFMARKCKFTGLPLGKGMYSDKSSMPAVVWCSLEGLVWLEEKMRNVQDLFVYMGRQDPTYPNPTMYGIPIEEVDYLTTATVFPTAATSVYSTEGDTAGTTNAGPRYYFMNLSDIYFTIHSDMFFYRHPMRTPYENPSRHTIYIDTYCNITSEQRRTSGIVYPNVDASGF